MHASDLLSLGYRPGAPSQECAAGDGPIAESIPCPKCGGRMAYRPWHSRAHRIHYIALAACTRCGHEEEF